MSTKSCDLVRGTRLSSDFIAKRRAWGHQQRPETAWSGHHGCLSGPSRPASGT